MDISKSENYKIKKYTESIRKEWERFVEEGDANEKVVRPIVLESWKRPKDFGVSHLERFSVPLDKKYFQKKLEENQELIEVSNPILKILAFAVKNSGFRIDLFS